MATSSHEWVTGEEAWTLFVKKYPYLGYPTGRWGFINFLRSHRTRSDPTLAREYLQKIDVLRRARGRFWLANAEHFPAAAFDFCTGVIPSLPAGVTK